MRHLTTAVALAFLAACAGSYTNGADGVNGPDSGGGGLTLDGGDAGDAGDAGDGGDAGTDAGFDGGCVHQSFNGTAVDTCFSTQPLPVTVIESACQVAMDWGQSNCTGVLSGPQNAFDGGCAGLPCTSPSIPGTITCQTAGGTCTIQICNASGCSP
jgi:hypothetical protein